MISLIVAKSKNNMIGKNGQIPWYLPEDLKYFKKVTNGNVVIMGRKTYESIGKPLPNRINIVVSQSLNKRTDGIIIAASLDEAIEIAKLNYEDKDIYLIGGNQIYKSGIHIVEKMYITEIDAVFDGDTEFITFDKTQWVEKTREEHLDDKIPYCFVTYEKL